jgi:hypothetical protein
MGPRRQKGFPEELCIISFEIVDELPELNTISMVRIIYIQPRNLLKLNNSCEIYYVGA